MLATCALIVLGFGSQPYDMGDHVDHDHKEDGTWDGAGATEDAVSMPTLAECADCVACADCADCVTDPTKCAAGTDLFQLCTVDCAAASTGGALADVCGSEKCVVTCAGEACEGCDTDPTKCYPAIGDQPAGEKYESCTAAGCADCQQCEACLTDPALCTPASPGGSLGYCAQCAALGR
jgi:hypothetical protein